MFPRSHLTLSGPAGSGGRMSGIIYVFHRNFEAHLTGEDRALSTTKIFQLSQTFSSVTMLGPILDHRNGTQLFVNLLLENGHPCNETAR